MEGRVRLITGCSSKGDSEMRIAAGQAGGVLAPPFRWRGRWGGCSAPGGPRQVHGGRPLTTLPWHCRINAGRAQLPPFPSDSLSPAPVLGRPTPRLPSGRAALPSTCLPLLFLSSSKWSC